MLHSFCPRERAPFPLGQETGCTPKPILAEVKRNLITVALNRTPISQYSLTVMTELSQFPLLMVEDWFVSRNMFIPYCLKMSPGSNLLVTNEAIINLDSKLYLCKFRLLGKISHLKIIIKSI
jgi:hypothetical protein